MSGPLNKHDGTNELLSIPGVGILLAAGTTVPTDGVAGYAPGCIFIDLDGSAGSRLFCNDGSVTSADFDAISVA